MNWVEKKQELLRDHLEWLGDLPARPVPVVTEVWRREYSVHTEIKVHYPDDNGDPVPAYLLKPRDPVRQPVPAIIALHQCGHLCDIGKEQVVGKCVGLPEQAYGLELVRRGFVVLAPDAKNVGERYDPEQRKPWQRIQELGGEVCCLGPGGSWSKPNWKRVSDIMSAVDVLGSLPDVDSERLGAIGFSMGADSILSAMPVESRLRAAAIISGGVFQARGENDCDTCGITYGDLLKMLAPRPVYLTMGKEDPINDFNADQSGEKTWDERLEPKRQAHEAAKAHYEEAGAGEKFKVTEFPGGHEFPEALREEAYDWFQKWLAEN